MTALRVAAAACLAGLTLAACGGTGGGSSTHTTGVSRTRSGGVVTFAQPPQSTANYIFPLQGLTDAGPVDDNQFQYLMYRPLYWFGDNGRAVVNHGLSLAYPPTYSADGRTVTIRLKPYKWSDGKPLTSRDVEFWINELKANKFQWIGYVPRGFPDNLVAESYPNATTVKLTFNRAYSPYWLLYNELSQITPMPQHAWDKTSSAGPVGNYDESTSGAHAVYKYLDAQSKDTLTYSTNPLWQVVDGPFKLKQFVPNIDAITLVPNKRYSGPVKPKIAELKEVPFTSYVSELDALHSGSIDYGYLPPTELSQAAYFRQQGYKVVAWPTYGIAYAVYNLTNPTVGPLFRQSYMRQALQLSVNQPADVKAVWGGYAVPTYGPVPIKPASSYLPPSGAHNPYPYSLHRAASLLRAHGWVRGGHGTLVCGRPGTGPAECGAGVRKGAVASFNIVYTNRVDFTGELEAWQSSLRRIGVQVHLSQAPFNQVEADASPCKPGGACTWQMAMWAGWTWAPDYLPNGDEIFETGATSNVGGFSDKAVDDAILATQRVQGAKEVAAMRHDDQVIAAALPVLFMPQFDMQVSVISGKLHGTLPQDPIGNIYPENWSLSR